MAPVAVGVDLGGTKVEVAAVDAGGTVLWHSRRPTRGWRGWAAVEEEIVRAVRAVMDGLDVVAVGVGVAGQVERGTGRVKFAPNLRWRGVPLGGRLRERLGVFVTVDNDVRCAAFGEWKHGAGQGADDLLCVFVGTGIGGGVVSGGRLLSGCGNAAGEVGHLTVDLRGPPCTCGNHGCLEAWAGGWAIARRARRAVEDEPARGARLSELAGEGEITARTVAQAFQEGDALAEEIVGEVVEALAAGLAGLTNAFDPGRIVLGGGVVEGVPELVERLEPLVRQRALTAATERLEIVRAALGAASGVVGAAALARQRWERENA